MVPNITMLFNKNNPFQPSSFHPIVLAQEFKSYYAENYGFKELFLTNYISIKKNVLKENALPNRIIQAENNWWFLSNHYNNSLNDVFGIEKFSEDDLFNISEYLHQWETYLKKQNIAFYVLIAPDKNKIYKEHLPFSLTSKTTRVEQLEDYLKNKDIQIINLTQPLLELKKEKEAYLKNDSHWNSFGAFTGYESLLNVIRQDFEITGEVKEDYEIKFEEKFEGDLPRLVYQEDLMSRPYLDKKKYNSNKIYDSDFERHFYNENKATSILTFHDSFMLAMMPFLNETFKNTRYLKSLQLDQSKIESYQPNIVVLELVERNLSDLISLKKPLEN